MIPVAVIGDVPRSPHALWLVKLQVRGLEARSVVGVAEW
jgi:hypothetical protein